MKLIRSFKILHKNFGSNQCQNTYQNKKKQINENCSTNQNIKKKKKILIFGPIFPKRKEV